MTGIAEDEDAAEALAIEAARKLAQINPEHDLLRLMGGRLSDQPGIESGAISDETLEAWRTERYDRFWQKDKPWREAPRSLVRAVSFANLTIALREAAGEMSPA
ncbi:MAG TPA: hypothetical protein VG984_02735 [Candidatus Paceibacterota bacterium]|nr:hypothetical protein [Candidatus Paceibacterota bacterium]